MAELFWSQGHPERAIEIYQRVLADRPDDAQLAARLRQMQAELNPKLGGPMDFKQYIQDIMDSVPGAMACTIMGYDGVAIDSVTADASVDFSTMFIECTASLNPLRTSPDGVPGAGAVTEVAVEGEKMTTLMRPISEIYFLGVILRRGGLTGKARYKMRLALPALRKDLT